MIIAAQDGQNAQTAEWIFIFVAVVIALFFLIGLLIFLTLFRPWIKSFLSGAGITLPQILGMRLRRVPVDKLCDLKIMATQAGLPVYMPELESAFLGGLDVELIVRSMIKAQRHGIDLDWERAVDQAKDGQFDNYLKEHDQQ